MGWESRGCLVACIDLDDSLSCLFVWHGMLTLC
jgi:hypothetical protein